MNEIRNLLIGIDFGEEYTQLCYYDRKADEPVSVAMKAGTTQYAAPTALCRRADRNEYCVGLEAVYFAREKEGYLVKDLYQTVGKQEPVMVGGEEKAPWELLAQYLKGMLKFLGVMEVIKNTRCLCITCPTLDALRIRNLKEACRELGLGEEQYLLMDYDESFYYYVMCHKVENWNRNAAWYSFDGDRVAFHKMSMGSIPALKQIPVRVEELKETVLNEEAAARDEEFLAFVQETVGTALYSSIQITGMGFNQEWAKKSVRYMCGQNRKVYYGNNLFAKGACASAREKLEERALRNYRYMSPSHVMDNVGIDMRVMGAPTYYPLIESGRNWYETKCGCEFLLDGTEELVFVVSSCTDTEKRRVAMPLTGLPKRPNKTTRIALEMEYISADQCQVTAKDLGFGEMFPSSGRVWKEVVQWQKEGRV